MSTIRVNNIVNAAGDDGTSFPNGLTTPSAAVDSIVDEAGTGAPDFPNGLTATDIKIAGSQPGILMNAITTEPDIPIADHMEVYAKSYGGRLILKSKGPAGLDQPYQAALWTNNAYIWSTTSATAGLWQNTVGAGAGTFTAANPTTTNLYTSIKRSRYANVLTTANQVLGQRNTDAVFFRGAVANQGGFFFVTRCGFDVWTNGGRFFAGMATATTVISANPSALANTVGFCVDATDAGAISFLTRDATTATKAATGFTITTNAGYDLYMYAPPNGSSISWRIVDINTGSEASGVATLTLPVNTTLLTANVLASNAALTPVTSIHLGINKIYVETDY